LYTSLGRHWWIAHRGDLKQFLDSEYAIRKGNVRTQKIQGKVSDQAQEPGPERRSLVGAEPPEPKPSRESEPDGSGIYITSLQPISP
jgi:hypothetical protein